MQRVGKGLRAENDFLLPLAANNRPGSLVVCLRHMATEHSGLLLQVLRTVRLKASPPGGASGAKESNKQTFQYLTFLCINGCVKREADCRW